MNQLPAGVGDAEAQRRFIETFRDFLLEHPVLQRLLEKVSLRTLEAPPQEQVAALLRLPGDDPAVIAFEDKVMAGRVVFGLGRIIADDFGELLTLSGNGRGIGAYKILRGMYERLVAAAYIAKNPSEARFFVEDDAIKKWKLWQQAVEVIPDLKDTILKEKIDVLEAEYKRVKAKRAESICNKCGQPEDSGSLDTRGRGDHGQTSRRQSVRVVRGLLLDTYLSFPRNRIRPQCPVPPHRVWERFLPGDFREGSPASDLVGPQPCPAASGTPERIFQTGFG
jgi:hypothetical protein